LICGEVLNALTHRSAQIPTFQIIDLIY